LQASSLAVLPLRYSFESGSVFDLCVSLLRRCPLKSPPLPPSSSPSLRTKLLCPPPPLDAPAAAAIVVPVLANEALVSGPGLNQRAVDTEVLARQPILVLSRLQHFV